MTDLTEQLRNGTLKEGFYYAKLPDNVVEIITEYGLDILKEVKDGDKIEVLAPVPSYEEWKAKLEENAQLKELLKEWVQFEIEENPNDFTVISERMSGLANKTKQAIGEKK